MDKKIETKRLILRTFQENDLNDLYEYLSNHEVVKYEPYKPMTIKEVKENLEYRISSDDFIAVELKDNQKMIGNLYLSKSDFNSFEIGFVFNIKYQNQGFATEACKAIIEDLFKNGIHRVFAMCDPKNRNSWKLLERLGFLKEAHLKQNVYFWKDENNNPIWKDTYIYSLLR